jgi:hypothetical protein
VAPGSPEAGEVKEGATVVIGMTGAAARPQQSGPRMPF